MSEVPKDLFDSGDEQDPSNSYKKKWAECLKLIKEEIPWQTFQTWFVPIIPISYHDETLALRVPSRFFFEWLESHFAKILNRIVKKVFSEKSKIEYLVAPAFLGEQDTIGLGHPAEKVVKNRKTAEKLIPIKIDTSLNPQHTFDNYFVHRNNRMVKKAAEYIATHLDISSYNPSFYYGDPGTGKTHLLNAIGNSISVRYPDKRIIHLGSEQYLHEYVCSLQNGKINDFKEVLTDSDVFLLDDIHYFSNKMSSQENLFYVISQLLKKNKRVVATSALPPNRLQKFNPRLISIFQKGLIVDLVIPEHDTRERIIRNFLKENGIRLADDIIELLTEKSGSNMHILNSVLVRIAAHISFSGDTIGLEECRMIMANLNPELQIRNGKPQGYPKITVDKIIRAVSAYFDIPPDVLIGISRHARTAFARQIAMYISRKYTGESLASVGYHFGDRNHSSVLYAYNKIQKRLREDSELRHVIEEIVKSIYRP